MTLEKFINIAYDVLYGDDEYRYIRVSNTSEGMMIGVLDWTGYKAIHLLQTIIMSMNPIKSTFILGYNLRHKIMNPYVEWDVVKFNSDLSNTEISRISSLLGTTNGIKIQDTYVLSDITTYAKDVIKTGVTNYGVALFMISQYMDWVPGFSEDIIATCRTYADSKYTSLHMLEDKLQPMFDSRGCIGRRSKNLFHKILSFIDNNGLM